MLFLLDSNQACPGITKEACEMCRTPAKSQWNNWYLWLEGGQLPVINWSFIKGRFERRRRNVEKEASMFCMLTSYQNTRHLTFIVQFHPHGHSARQLILFPWTDKDTEIQRRKWLIQDRSSNCPHIWPVEVISSSYLLCPLGMSPSFSEHFVTFGNRL